MMRTVFDVHAFTLFLALFDCGFAEVMLEHEEAVRFFGPFAT